jgi:hypothetical protein
MKYQARHSCAAPFTQELNTDVRLPAVSGDYLRKGLSPAQLADQARAAARSGTTR